MAVLTTGFFCWRFLIGAFAGAGSVVADACGQWRVSMSPMALLAMEGNGVAERFANRVTGAVFEGTLRGGREGYDNIFAFDVHAFDAVLRGSASWEEWVSLVGGMGDLSCDGRRHRNCVFSCSVFFPSVWESEEGLKSCSVLW